MLTCTSYAKNRAMKVFISYKLGPSDIEAVVGYMSIRFSVTIKIIHIHTPNYIVGGDMRENVDKARS